MKLTYRQLWDLLIMMNDEQLDSDLTVENVSTGECYQATLIICGEDHDSLDKYHPVIAFSEEGISSIQEHDGYTDMYKYWKAINE